MPKDRSTWPYASTPSLWSWVFRSRDNLVELGSPPRTEVERPARARTEFGQKAKVELRSSASLEDFRETRRETGKGRDTAAHPGQAPARTKPFFILVLQAVLNLPNLGGRASRQEFGAYVVFYFAVALFGGFLPVLAREVAPELAAITIPSLIWFILFLTLLSVSLRRMHDTGRRGWWLLFSVTNPITALLAVYRLLQPGDPGSNAFGPAPKD